MSLHLSAELLVSISVHKVMVQVITLQNVLDKPLALDLPICHAEPWKVLHPRAKMQEDISFVRSMNVVSEWKRNKLILVF